MPLEPESDLHWTAFLYLSGDLPLDETERFEARLADDQAARDALADSVELAGALAIVAPEFRPRRRRIGRRALFAATALAAAACLVLTFSSWLRRPIPQDRPDASEVALAWSSLRGGADVDWLALPTGSPLVEAAQIDPDPEVEIEIEPSTDRDLPSWLLSAASVPLDDTREED